MNRLRKFGRKTKIVLNHILHHREPTIHDMMGMSDEELIDLFHQDHNERILLKSPGLSKRDKQAMNLYLVIMAILIIDAQNATNAFTMVLFAINLALIAFTSLLFLSKAISKFIDNRDMAMLSEYRKTSKDYFKSMRKSSSSPIPKAIRNLNESVFSLADEGIDDDFTNMTILRLTLNIIELAERLGSSPSDKDWEMIDDRLHVTKLVGLLNERMTLLREQEAKYGSESHRRIIDEYGVELDSRKKEAEMRRMVLEESVDNKRLQDLHKRILESVDDMRKSVTKDTSRSA